MTSHKQTLEHIIPKDIFFKLTLVNISLYCSIKLLFGLFYDTFFYLLVNYKSQYNLTPTLTSTLSNMYNYGALASSLFIHFPNKFLSKKQIVCLGILICLFTLILQALIEHIHILFLCRFIHGTMETILYIYANDISVEFLPVKNRGFLISLPNFFMQLGPIISLLTIYVISPKFEEKMIKYALLVMGIFPLLIFILYYKFIEESPNELLENRQYEKYKKILLKFKVLEKEIDNNINNHLSKTSLLSNDTQSKHESFSSLFKMKYLKLTIAVLSIKFFSTFLSRGLSAGAPFFIKNHIQQSDKSSNGEEFIINMILSSFISMFKPFISLINDFPSFGRIGCMKITAFISFLFCCFMLINIKYLSFLNGIIFSFMGANSLISYIYTTEVFPFELRKSAMAGMTLISAVSAFISQSFYINISFISYEIMVYVSICIAFINFVICYLLDIETQGKEI